MKEKKNRYLCLHGHFYQPPRENPWIEEIELQESARPYHDWNERIHDECYLPNALARVYDDEGRIIRIINNFEGLSFNVGPTLMSWLEVKQPRTYERVLEADRVSQTLHEGHGNAIAQAYNHMIMPLANRRDKVTQIRWGVRDFESRFERKPESIWLPETACNEETLEILIEEGITFIILEPHQADKIRSIGQEEWNDVSDGSIDPKKPYRYFWPKDRSKFIDIFFYDGPISKAVSFESLLQDVKGFMNRLDSAADNDSDQNQLIHLATDGETYGHHRKFGERSLAYLFSHEAHHQGYEIVNYGQYLAKNPPADEVLLKTGENGEGTSWSCLHGVKRWKEHCGCRGDGPEHWGQHWRKPLRESLYWLQGQINNIFEEKGGAFLKDVWAARNDYISVILDRSDEQINRFFEAYQTRELSHEERILCLKLMESQRNAMLMFTSCGWFFTELSGIETVQILRYASRALQLASEVAGYSLEGEFLERLSQAKSNIAAYSDGRKLYEKWVKPNQVTLHHIVSAYAICSIFDIESYNVDSSDHYIYHLESVRHRKESFGDLTMNLGRVRVTSKMTLEETDVIFVALQMGLYDIRCSMMPFQSDEEYEKIESDFFEWLQTQHIVEILKKIDEIFGESYHALKDLPSHERRRIITFLTQEMLDKISIVYEKLYDENRRMNEVYRSIQLPIPQELRHAVQHALTKRLERSVHELAEHNFEAKKATRVYHILEAAQSFEIEIDMQKVTAFLSQTLERLIKEYVVTYQAERISECLQIIKLAQKIKVSLDLRGPQNDAYYLMETWKHHPEEIPREARSTATTLLKLIKSLGFETASLRKAIRAASVNSCNP